MGRLSFRKGVTDGRTVPRTDLRTDRPSYRDTRTHLKMALDPQDCPISSHIPCLSHYYCHTIDTNLQFVVGSGSVNSVIMLLRAGEKNGGPPLALLAGPPSQPSGPPLGKRGGGEEAKSLFFSFFVPLFLPLFLLFFSFFFLFFLLYFLLGAPPGPPGARAPGLSPQRPPLSPPLDATT